MKHILQSVGRVAGGVPVRVWTVDGVFRSAEQIVAEPLKAAAANWLALATYVGRLQPRGASILIDIGSTTCDIIPLRDGLPRPVGRTDPTRLASGELVYCGVRRTPLCAILGLSKAAEWFATTEDAYVVLGDLPEDHDRHDGADGRPMTRNHAQARLARMECDEAWPWERALEFARQVRDIQVRHIAGRVIEVARRLPPPIDAIVQAGAGEFLVPTILEAAGLGSIPRISLAESLGPTLSTAACAHAVALLAGEER